VGFGGWGLGLGPQPPTPQSPIPNPHFNLINLLNFLFLNKKTYKLIIFNIIFN